MPRFFFLLLMLFLLSPTSLAARHAKKPLHRKTAPVHQAAQVPFSFLPPRQPNTAVQRLQTPLTGRVEVTLPVSPPHLPQYTQIFPSLIQPEMIRPIQATQPSRHSHRTAFHWGQSAPKIRKADYAERSWVEDINTEQAKVIATSITHYLSQQIPPESTTLLMAIPAKNQRKNPLTPVLNAELRKAGFALVDRRSQSVNVQMLQYQVSRFNDGLWVKLRLPNTETNQFYHLNFANQPVASTGLTVRSIMNSEGGMK
jgi:hypothetical protein